ncbi:MAG: DNA-binding protein [Frankiales bacterium]|nr:DNA-binding protein [Frankiales bacterium]
MAHQDLLSVALRRLAGLASPEQLLREAARLVVPAVATWCLADLLTEPDLVTRVASRGPDGSLDLPPDMGGRESRRSSAQSAGVLRQLGEAPGGVLHLSREEIAAAGRSADERLRAQASLVQELGTTDLLIIGLSSRQRMRGVLTLGLAEGAFDDAQVQALGELGSLLAVLLDNLALVANQRTIATALQTSLLPRLPHLEGFDLAARYVPADRALEVGGDWYDVFATSPSTTALVIGDITGHDLYAAAQMAELRSLVRAYAVDDAVSPVRVLRATERALSRLGLTTSATCLFALLTCESGAASLEWSAAGHPPPILVRAGAAEVLSSADDLMLGVEASTTRHGMRKELREDDLIVLYTDGLLENRRDPFDERLETLKDLLASMAGAGLEEQAERLVRGLSTGEDDTALLLVRVRT